jgi:hypothetical protein
VCSAPHSFSFGHIGSPAKKTYFFMAASSDVICILNIW